MTTPSSFFMPATCPRCRLDERHSTTVTYKASRTVVSIVCAHCKYARAGDVERQGPNTLENLIQDIGRAIRNGDLKKLVDRDAESTIPPSGQGKDDPAPPRVKNSKPE